MGDPKVGHPADAFHQGPDDSDRDREALDAIFQAGARARGAGTALCDNPYAPGSEERQEWTAGWRATIKPDDADDEPNSGYEPN